MSAPTLTDLIREAKSRTEYASSGAEGYLLSTWSDLELLTALARALTPPTPPVMADRAHQEALARIRQRQQDAEPREPWADDETWTIKQTPEYRT